jgi:hypothetical protein
MAKENKKSRKETNGQTIFTSDLVKRQEIYIGTRGEGRSA